MAKETSASQIAEAAAVLPIMFIFLLGIFWFGQAYRIHGTLAHAAREAARAGSAPPCATCAAASLGGNTLPYQLATKAATDALQVAKLDPTQLALPVPQSLTHCDTTPSNTCDSSLQNVCVQSNVVLSSSAPGFDGAGVCGISVTLRYPFQFWLPGNSISMQKIQLQAVGRERMETR